MNSSNWVLDTDGQLITVETLRANRKFSAVVLESPYTRFLSGLRLSYLHPQIRIEIRIGRMIVPISFPQPTIIGLLKMKKVIIIFNSIKIITYEIKWLNNIPQSVEHGCQRTVAPPFGSLDSARASQQIAPLGSTHVQEM